MFLYERVLTDIKESRDRVVNGLINCIPCPFKRFRATFPGLEKGKYIIFTASSKIGKTQISDEMALYNSFMYAFHHRDQIRLKVFYFTLEMSKEAKYRQFMCYLLYRLSSGKIRIDSKDLRSVNEEKPLTEEILALLKSDPYVEYYKFFEECVEFIDSIRNPTGIYKFCRAYAKAHGTQHTKQVPIKDKNDNVIEIKELDDYYEEDDLDEYRIIFVDHYKLFTLESGKDLRDTIGTWSSDYAITLRNKYHYTIIGVQQQAASQESNENQKLGKLKPTLDGLGDNKTTQQDADLILGLYSPYRYGIREYEGYDITKFRDNIRFLEILGGREGGGGDICPLYFDGAVNFFKELPLPNDRKNLEVFYKVMEKNREIPSENTSVSLLSVKLNTQNGKNSNSCKKWIRKVHKYWRNS